MDGQEQKEVAAAQPSTDQIEGERNDCSDGKHVASVLHRHSEIHCETGNDQKPTDLVNSIHFTLHSPDGGIPARMAGVRQGRSTFVTEQAQYCTNDYVQLSQQV